MQQQCFTDCGKEAGDCGSEVLMRNWGKGFMRKYLVSFDQGTTSSRTIVFDSFGRPVSSGQVEFKQIYPKPGWVEHDPRDI